MAYTIYDIARKANVGVGTVSRVLNNHPSVSTETRAHVLAVARKYNYHPNASAQRLARKRSRTITVILPFFTNYFFLEMLRGIQDKVREIDYDLVLHGVNHPEQAMTALLRSLRGGHVDGILFISMDIPEEYVAKYKSYRTPVVLIDRYHPEMVSLTVENVRGAYDATMHLIAQGHERIGLINGHPKSLPARERREGFLQAVEECGITRHVIIEANDPRNEDGFNRQAGYEAAMRMLSLGQEAMPTALFVASDVQAIGVLQAFRQRNIRVPADVAIVGFDDIELAEHFGLSTMRQPIYRMGVLGVERLLQVLDKKVDTPLHDTFEPTLIVRQSCGAAHRSHPAL